MATARTNTQIIKGGQLMLFIGSQTIAFATAHSLSITMNTVEINTKDHGDYTHVLPTTVTWEISTENLFSTDGGNTLRNAILNKTQLTVAFALSDYAGYASGSDEKGIVDSANGNDEWTATTNFVTGKAYVTSLTVNANSGENATFSATLTGSGRLSVPA